MALPDLNVRLGLITKRFEKSLNDVDRKLRRFQRNIEGIGQDLTNSITVPLAGLGAASLASFADFEKGAKALEAVTKDAKSVADQLEDLREVAKLPGLGFQEAVQGSARLQAVGLSADEAARTLGEFGNAVARSGGGRVELEGALLALTQIASKGKISAEEINQLNERIFEIRPALEAAFGTSNSEELQKLGISSEEFIAKVTDEFSKLERVQGGLANSFENFGDSVRTNLARVGDIINKSFDVGDLIDRFDRALTNVVDTFSNLDAGTQKTIVRVAAFAAALGPGLLVLSKFFTAGRTVISTLSLLNSSFSVLSGSVISAITNIKKFNVAALLTPQILALTAAVGAAVFIWSEFKRRIDLANQSQRAVASVNQEAEAAVVSETAKIKTLIGIIKDERTSREAKVRAIEQIKQANPEYFGQLDAENIKISDLDKAYENLTKSVLLRAKASAAESQIEDIARRELETQRAILKIREDVANAEGVFSQEFIAASERKLKRRNEELAAINKEKNAIVDLFATTQSELLEFEGSVSAPDTKEIERVFERPVAAATELQKEIRKIKDELAAIDTKESILGKSFAEDSERLSALEKGIESLVDLGAGQENQFIQALSRQLDELQEKTTLTKFDTKALEAGVAVQISADLGLVSPISIPGITEAEAAIFAYQNRLREATDQANVFGVEAGDLLGEKLNITRNALSAAVDTFGANSEAVALLKEQYVELNAQLDAANEKQIRQQEALQTANALAGTLGAGITEFFTALEEGSKNAFQSFVEGFRKAIGELLKRLAIALVQAIAVAAVLSIIFPGVSAGGASFAKNLKSVFGSGIPGLAEGGIVPPGFPNDTFPARLSSGEAVIPLDRLSSITGGNTQQVFIPDLRISGEDLVIVFNKAQDKFNRFS